MAADTPRVRPRVVVAGAGMAGMEAALALRAFTDDGVSVTVVDAGRRFAVPATAAGSAFGIAPPVDIPVSRLVTRAGATFRPSHVAAVDPSRRLVMLAGGELLGYEELIVAVGGRPVPHIAEALTFRGHADVEELRGLVEGIAHHAERGGTTDLAIVIPPGCAWPLTGYEIALMAREHLVDGGRGERSRLVVLTAEDTPLAMFGSDAGASVLRTLRRAGVDVVTGAVVTSFDWGRLITADGDVHAADRVVALPLMRGPALEGLPMDAAGFVLCDGEGRVAGAPGVRVVGDAGTLPLKEGGIACHQADVAAAAIAREHGASVGELPFAPSLPDWIGDGGGEGAGGFPAAPGSRGDGLARWPVPKVVGRFLAPFLRDVARSPADAIPR